MLLAVTVIVVSWRKWWSRRLPHMRFELAQVNISRLLAPLDDPQLDHFVAVLDPVNAAADVAPGFVWRLQTEDGNATAVRAFDWDAGESAGVVVNLTVWRDIEHLAAGLGVEPHPTRRVLVALGYGIGLAIIKHAVLARLRALWSP
jgi:hypothetical protein